jgi:hypothetical protein
LVAVSEQDARHRESGSGRLFPTSLADRRCGLDVRNNAGPTNVANWRLPMPRIANVPVYSKPSAEHPAR